jgi:hypothetical protein
MSRPVRFRDDDSAPAHVRDLLRSVGRSRPMTDEVRARSAARIDRLAAVPVAAGLVLWIKGVAIAAGLGVVGVAVVMRVLPANHASVKPLTTTPTVSAGAPASRGGVEIPAPPPPRAAPTATPIPTATPTPIPTPIPTATPTPIPTASSDSDLLAREVALLEKARGSLDRDPASSLTTLEAHAAEFPTGTLRMERELLAVDALRRLGRFTDARTRGEALLARAPGSIYEGRVRTILASLPPASP